MALYNITTKKEFEEKVLGSDKAVLVDFWASWCPPCRAMAPILHDLGDEIDKTADIVKIDIEDGKDNAELASEYGVQSIPNMNIFVGGKVIGRVIGAVPKSQLVSEIEKAQKSAKK